jgi:DNA polymerase-4
MVMGLEVNPTTYFLKINYEYGTKRKMSRTVDRIFSENLFREQLLEMFDEVVHYGLGAVKLTLNVSNFTNQQHKTLSLLDLHEDMERANLTKEIQGLRDRFGIDIIKSGVEL